MKDRFAQIGRYTKIRKRDIILLACLAFICVFVFIAVNILRKSGKPGDYVRVYVDGEVIKELPLDRDAEYDVSNSYGRNRIIINSGEAYVDYADCPDRICVKHVPISRDGEQIVCIPHRMIVSVVTVQ